MIYTILIWTLMRLNKMRSGIYSITNKKDGKRLIGSTKNFNERIRKHRSELRNNKHKNPKIQNAWNKHGEKNFFFEFIEEVDSSPVLLCEMEQSYLDDIFIHKKYEAYNINPYAGRGPDMSGIPLSKEHKQKLSDALTGIPRSPETRAKISASNMGKVMSSEAREKMSEAKKGSTPWNKGGSSWSKGRAFTEEHKAKIAAAQSVRRVSAKTTPEQVEEIIQKYTSGEYSQRQLSEEYNLTQSGVSRLLKRTFNKRTS